VAADADGSDVLEAVVTRVVAAVVAGGGEEVRLLVRLHVGYVGRWGGWSVDHLLVFSVRVGG